MKDPPEFNSSNNNNNNNSNNNNNNHTIKNLALDQTNPYYLHPAENPGVVLVFPPLSENNYESWSRSMKCSLLSKNKIKFVNGKLLKANEDDNLFDAWE